MTQRIRKLGAFAALLLPATQMNQGRPATAGAPTK